MVKNLGIKAPDIPAKIAGGLLYINICIHSYKNCQVARKIMGIMASGKRSKSKVEKFHVEIVPGRARAALAAQVKGAVGRFLFAASEPNLRNKETCFSTRSISSCLYL